MGAITDLFAVAGLDALLERHAAQRIEHEPRAAGGQRQRSRDALSYRVVR
jgi:hypothetical protein